MSQLRVVDARGLLCPWPVIRLSRTAREMGFEGRVRILADDPIASNEIEQLCRERRWRFAAVEAEPDVYEVEFG